MQKTITRHVKQFLQTGTMKFKKKEEQRTQEQTQNPQNNLHTYALKTSQPTFFTT